MTAGDRTSVLLVRPGEPAARETRDAQLPDYQSDARVLHYASQAGLLVALDVIDGSHALTTRDGWLNVTADGPIAELHIGLDRGTMDLQSFNPPPRLRFEGHAIASLQTIKLNGCERPMSHSYDASASLVIDASEWAGSRRASTAGASLATQQS